MFCPKFQIFAARNHLDNIEDPCPDTFKYLELDIKCKGKSIMVYLKNIFLN